MIQTSCSELLVDTKLTDPITAFGVLSNIFHRFNLVSNPSLSINLLDSIKNNNQRMEVIIYDIDGNRCWLEYGDNGYIETGFRFDAHCNHGDSRTFPIFKRILDEVKTSELYACDGGSTDCYEEWENEKC